MDKYITTEQLIKWLQEVSNTHEKIASGLEIEQVAKSHRKHAKMNRSAADRLQELEAVAGRLPHAKDGKPILEGDVVYGVFQEGAERNFGGPVPRGEVIVASTQGNGVRIAGYDGILWGNECFYSTEEAAQRQGGGDVPSDR